MTNMRRTERFGLVLSTSEREGLRYLAEMEGLAEADVLRRLLRLAINGLPPECKDAIDWPSTPPRLLANGKSSHLDA